MQRIEGMIKLFDKSTLRGESRAIVNDTFSNVTSALQAIFMDLGQERVNIIDEAEAGNDKDRVE